MFPLVAPEIPGNFNNIKSADTFVTIQWDPNVDWGQTQTFYLQYRVQGLLEWTTILIGEEAINESKKRRTYTLSNLQRGKAYELRMYAANTAGKRSNVTDSLIVFTGYSGENCTIVNMHILLTIHIIFCSVSVQYLITQYLLHVSCNLLLVFDLRRRNILSFLSHFKVACYISFFSPFNGTTVYD